MFVDILHILHTIVVIHKASPAKVEMDSGTGLKGGRWALLCMRALDGLQACMHIEVGMIRHPCAIDHTNHGGGILGK